ncbi:hypothetical protein BJP25_07440 [Actinokineospora bangkokensis]|uniref:Carboxylic ester hydrolase n=1 Tax=Actinokineospora bangkokensis TaxID=1193682 RepID=A0A1Q9LSX6_9PSEU|nr:hypothetical protein BJP25_07440 [Actinokineospora bangkokensis]
MLVWVHGGGLRSGAGSDYDMRRFAAEQDVVVVTTNYRLGAFGFLDVPGLDGGGQFGLLDQQAALRWVRDNAAAFGGDPGNVTVAGESGGGDSVCAQLASPEAAGLFHRAVIQSGTCGDTSVVEAILPGAGPVLAAWKPAAVAEPLGVALAGSLGCTDPATAVDCLRGVPAPQLREGADKSGAYYSPTIGRGVLPESPGQAIAGGAIARVPVLTGIVEAEGALFLSSGGFAEKPLTEETFTGMVTAAAGPRAAEAIAAYTPKGGATFNNAWSRVVTDRAWSCANLRVFQGLSAENPTYAYEFADASAPNALAVIPEDLRGKATHGAELPYLFTLVRGQPALTAEQEELGRSMRATWAGFMRDGTPGPWPSFQDKAAITRLTTGGTTQVDADDFAAAHHCDIWAR